MSHWCRNNVSTCYPFHLTEGFLLSTFARNFALTSLEKHSPAWWTDLLNLWEPSGSQSDGGLRFAVRKGYCNFYIHGQSVGLIDHDRPKRPRLNVHHKYVDGAPTGKTHVQFVGNKPADLVAIVAKARNHRVKEATPPQNRPGEKTIVDLLVGENIDVIDLEVGIPTSYLKPSSSTRIDLVCLERREGKILLVFWEVKLIDDARICSTTTAEVIGQMRDYKSFLEHDEARDHIIKAYANACATLAAVHATAKALRPDIAPLSALLTEVVANPSILDVDTVPRLVVHGKALTPQRKGHLDDLARQVPLLHLEDGNPLKLGFVAVKGA